MVEKYKDLRFYNVKKKYVIELREISYVAQWLGNDVPRFADIRSRFGDILANSDKFLEIYCNFNISQKELHTIARTTQRCKNLLYDAAKTVNEFTYHAAARHNLDPTLAKHRSHSERFAPWTTTVQEIRVRIFRVKGEDNVVADVMT